MTSVTLPALSCEILVLVAIIACELSVTTSQSKAELVMVKSRGLPALSSVA